MLGRGFGGDCEAALGFGEGFGFDADVVAVEDGNRELDSLLMHLDVIAVQHILVAYIQFPVGNNRVRPRGHLCAIGLFETAPLDVLLAARLEQ